MTVKKFFCHCMALCLMASVLINNEMLAQASQLGRQKTNQAEAENEAKADLETEGVLSEFTQAEIEGFYDDSVFVGDSLMLGFRNYAMKRKDDTLLSRIKFLAAGSLSVHNSFWDVENKDSVHPLYQGKKRYIWDSISLMKGKRVFIMLGVNDINVYGLEKTRDKYEELVGKIEESNPDAEVHIMSMTYVLHGKEKGNLENDTIREFNAMLEELAEENGWGYVALADSLADENGDLAEKFCSDGFVHQNAAAYDVWVSVLKDYAAQRLSLEDAEGGQTKEEAADSKSTEKTEPVKEKEPKGTEKGMGD